jgi:DNA-binding transcriptional LysR family regulator
MQPGFNWNDLKFLVAVARAGNPNAASKLLKVDHNTVRRRIAALEQDLGAQLFDRRSDHLALTDVGEKLLRFAETIENAATGAEAEIAGRDAALSGNVRIGVPDGLGTLFVAPLMVELRNLYPSLSIELVVTSRDFNLSKREADMAIIIERPVRGNMIIKKLTDCRMRIYAAQSYLDRFPPIESPADLANHIFVSGFEGLDFGAAVNQMIDEGALAPKLTCSSSIAQLKAAAAGGGLCAFARFLAHTEPSLIPVLEEQVSLDLEIWLAYHADLKELRRIKVVAAFLAKAFEHAHRHFS